ncbi:hypothetical protein MVEN_00113600 [Mycena venus]|uniref:Uncharacterized protein n=1 Tax=Mycena venus TaxID=2733690 RepID=A0A8H6Z846_9AGAR|nr:hypothetical protein MVEN_00113600 [Mycena venus]
MPLTTIFSSKPFSTSVDPFSGKSCVTVDWILANGIPYTSYIKQMPRITMYMFVLRTPPSAREFPNFSDWYQIHPLFLFRPSVVLADPVKSSV